MTTGGRLRSVLITGGRGNLGRKLTAHLIASDLAERVVALDRPGAPSSAPHSRVHDVTADLADPRDGALAAAIEGVDAVVHFAASNPAPNAPWDQSRESFEMTLRVAHEAVRAGARRIVFASSNHAMGKYKDAPYARRIGPGELGPETLPAPGTLFDTDEGVLDGVAYGATKLLGESAFGVAAERSGGRTTSVSLRIGWCQAGENRAETINAAGGGASPGEETPSYRRALRWFRNMWLSDRDFAQLLERALLADASGWPSPAVVVNGMSANRGMAWDLRPGERWLGYRPQDDVWTALGLEPPPAE
ncbi:NAD(P)-dependent oxidoreductase [Alsobacter sp. SYSU M60028]|uniref:NAD(P)-dependent oxidoreductase n=1 Tax=Alsobacter ponti TaxID=2962936 RepID=A0ABT1LFQ7_9HYPH|nr:NAD(P)-dependent oxidoreductase [Alsobacter ponti]MCP8940332.1 NAD(P)-dependent oxidoreductase [Alsobacter ponti]